MRYLNYAGTSYPKPDSVLNAVNHALMASPQEQRELLESATAVILDEFQNREKGKVQGNLLLTSGCTAGLALALQRLPHRDLLLTSQLEHEALLQPVRGMVHLGGVEHRELAYRSGTPVDLDQLEKLLAGGRVGVVALSSASNITGEFLPLAEVSALTRRFGVVLLVDAAQSFGTDHFLTVCEFADVVVAGGHKAALGPQGVGVLFARNGVDFLSSTAVCEVGETPCDSSLGYCDVGSVNVAGACGLAAGLRSTRGRRKELAQRVRGLANEVREALAGNSSVRLLGPAIGEIGLPIVSLVPLALPLQGLERQMARQGLSIRVGTHCAPQALRTLGAPEGCARVSFGEKSDASDARRVVEFFAVD